MIPLRVVGGRFCYATIILCGTVCRGVNEFGKLFDLAMQLKFKLC